MAPTSTLDSATLHSDDQPSIPRAVVRRRALVGPLESATTTAGQLVAVAGDPADAVGGRPGALLGEGLAGGVLPVVVPLGGPDSPVATADGYIGDADVVSTATSLGGDQLILLREQRHYARAFAPAITLEEGFAPITALSVGMDFRGDSIVLWAQGGEVHAQWVTNDGDIYAAQTLGPAGYAPALAAVLSDNDHAFVMWTDEPAPGRPGEARIFLEHSGNNVALPVAPQLLAEFAEPAAQRLGPGSIALVRVTPSEGVLAAWTLIASGNYEVQAAGLTSSQVLPAATIAEPGVDLRLAALATGPRNDFVAVLEAAPRSPAASTRASRRSSPRAACPAAPAGSPSRRRPSSRRPASTATRRSRSTPTATARWWPGRRWSAGCRRWRMRCGPGRREGAVVVRGVPRPPRAWHGLRRVGEAGGRRETRSLQAIPRTDSRAVERLAWSLWAATVSRARVFAARPRQSVSGGSDAKDSGGALASRIGQADPERRLGGAARSLRRALDTARRRGLGHGHGRLLRQLWSDDDMHLQLHRQLADLRGPERGDECQRHGNRR